MTNSQLSLRIGQDNLTNILGAMEDGVYIVDQAYNIQYVNQVLEKEFGSYEGHKCFEYFHDREEVCPWCKAPEVFAGKTVCWEWTSSKNHKIYDLQGIPIRNNDGSISKMEIFRDISDRKQAEQALKKSESQLRQIIDLVPHLIFVKDETGRFEIVNKAIAEVYGTTVENLTGKREAEFIATEEEHAHFRADDLEVIHSGKTKFIPEESITDSENKTRSLQTTKVPFKLSVTNKPGILGIAVDISERVQLEKELNKERQRLQYILEGTNVGTWEWNIQTGEVIFNERWANIIGYTLEELSPTSIDTWMKVAHPDDMDISGALLEKHFSGELDYYELETRMRHKNGDWIWVQDRGKVSVWTEEGKPLQMFGTHQDITERKQAEEALQKAKDNLEQRVAERTEELEKIHEQLRHVDKLAAMGQFTASIAHEINNPLTGIMNVLARLQRKVTMEENEAEFLAMALHEGERMRRLIQDLQGFNRPSSGKKAVFELQKAVAIILKLSGKEQRQHHVNVETRFASAPIKINGVEDQIKQVFLNLIRNSMDALPDSGGKITLTTTVEGQLATISFHDTGCGIKPEHLNKIFDSFFTTKTAVKGTGLGLSVSYNIIKAHGGDISVRSELNQGTTFIITLPIYPNTREITL